LLGPGVLINLTRLDLRVLRKLVMDSSDLGERNFTFMLFTFLPYLIRISSYFNLYLNERHPKK
jgi:hypothetical protein